MCSSHLFFSESALHVFDDLALNKIYFHLYEEAIDEFTDNKIRHFAGIMVQTTTFFAIINWINSNRCAELKNDKLKGKF